MTTAPLIPQLNLIGMGFTAILSIAVPLFLFFSFKNRFQARKQAFFFGFCTFIIFAMGIKSFANEYFLSPDRSFSQALLPTTIAYAVYVGLTAGILEEIGRFLCMSSIMRNVRKEDALLFGVGHGCVEAFFIGTFTMVQNLIVGMALNKIGSIEGYVAQAQTAEQAEEIRTSLTAMVNTSAGQYLLAGVERMAVLAIQISFSVIIYKAVQRKKYSYLLLCILLHTLINTGIALYQNGLIITNIFLLDAGICLAALIIGIFAYRQYQSLKYEEY